MNSFDVSGDFEEDFVYKPTVGEMRKMEMEREKELPCSGGRSIIAPMFDADGCCCVGDSHLLNIYI